MTNSACPPIWLWSDLHLEFGDVHAARTRPKAPPAEHVVLLVGDIATGTKGVRWALDTFPNNRVAYILGNHECYYADVDLTIRACRDAAAGSNVRILERETWDVAPGTRILGATLWTNYRLWAEQSMEELLRVAHQLSDHRVISTDGRVFTPDDARRRHTATRLWLELELRRANRDNVRTIVATHHAPSVECIAPHFRRARTPLSAAFASDLSHLLLAPFAPEIWVSGHTHFNYVGTVGRTRLVSNQGGYAFRDEEGGFVPQGLLVSGPIEAK